MDVAAPTADAIAPGEVDKGPDGDVGDVDPLAAAEGATAAATGDPQDDAVHLDAAPTVSRPAAMRFSAPDPTAVPPVDAYSLRLVAGHRLWDAGVGVRHSSHLAGLAAPPRARANPYDLEKLGHASGARVRIVSPRGSLVLEVEADAGVLRGSVAIGFNLPGDGAGDLIDATTAITNVRLDSV
jgi:anaerobic selenocysteine-containing dehydrogenase